jgi:HSP90 family molecular chaperone
MVADKVTLRSRRAGASGAVEWESTGDGTYFLRDCDKPDRGTSVTLHLKADLISKMQTRLAANPEDPSLTDAAKVLYGVALLSERSQLTDPASFNRAATQILCQAL